jgi:LmbE family N-acetylglucosaminyl deacetylase
MSDRVMTFEQPDRPNLKLRLRRALAPLLRIVLNARAQSFDSCGVGSFVVIAPHPDDETFGCGGTLAILAEVGTKLVVLFITDGAASHPGHPDLAPARLAALRKDEARCAMSILGVPSAALVFLDAPDGALEDLPQQLSTGLVVKIASALRESGAAAVLLPCRNDGSSEHEAVFRLTLRAVAESGVPIRILEYPVWSWWSPRLLLRCIGTYARVWRSPLGAKRQAKAEAMAAYVSQTRPIPPQTTSALPQGFAAAFDNDVEFFFER